MFVVKINSEKMKSPSPILRGSFVGGVGALLVSVLFSVNGWPAAELFAILGSLTTVSLYALFSIKAEKKKASNYPRHLLILSLTAAIILKSFGLAAGSWLFLIAFLAFLIWFTWSVLEELPPSNNESK